MIIHQKEKVNDTTKRFPRTIVEAFGTDADAGLRVSDKMHHRDKIVIVASIFSAIASAIIFIVF